MKSQSCFSAAASAPRKKVIQGCRELWQENLHGWVCGYNGSLGVSCQADMMSLRALSPQGKSLLPPTNGHGCAPPRTAEADRDLRGNAYPGMRRRRLSLMGYTSIRVHRPRAPICHADINVGYKAPSAVLDTSWVASCGLYMRG